MSRQERENVNTDVKTVTDKEVGATAIYHVVKADLIHSGVPRITAPAALY